MPPKTTTRTDWHEAIFCAVQIDLKEYSHLLEYYKEKSLSANNNRMDMLIIKKQSGFQISKHIAFIFRAHNIFEMKGLSTSLTSDAYHKTNGHAGYYIDLYPGTNILTRHDISLTFPTFHYPRKLFKHLTKECNKTIDNPFPGVYYINEEMYATQVLVISELSSEDSMYLHCLKKENISLDLVDTLASDYALNKNNKLYASYMNQFFYSHMKGEQFMVCEGLLNYFGTSSKELLEQGAQKAQEIYLPQIEQLTSEKNLLTSEKNLLVSENYKLKQLLAQNNIAY